MPLEPLQEPADTEAVEGLEPSGGRRGQPSHGLVPEGDDDKEDPLKVGEPPSSDEPKFIALDTVDMPSAVNSRVNSDEDIYCKERAERYEVPIPCKFGPWPSDPPSVPIVPMMMD